MKLIVNTETFQFPLRGVGTYLYNLLKGFHKSDAVDTLLCFDGSDRLLTFEEIKGQLAQSAPDRKEVTCNEGFTESDRKALDAVFASLTETHSDAIYIEPDCISRPFAGRTVPLIYDLSSLRHPEYHSDPYVARMNEFLPQTMDKASHVISVSEFTRGEICSIWNIPKEKVSIVYPGVHSDFKLRTAETVAPVLKEYNLPSRYLLVVGTLEPKKNLVNLVAAFSRLPQILRKKHPLVLVGARSWDTDRLEHVLSRYEGSRELFWLGYVDQKDLPFIYSGAYGFVYPSVYEGFGISILEAMASGVPVLTSNQAAMPEVADEVALLTNPLNLSSLTNNLERLIKDEGFRSGARKAGLNKAKEFTWSNSLDRMFSILKKLN